MISKIFLFLISDAFSRNFHVCFDERHIFRATKSAKIKKQNKKVSTFGQKSAQLPEVIYLQSDLVEVTFFFQNYSKTSI